MNSEKSSIWGREVHYVLKPLGNLFISKEFIRHSGRDERALKKSFTITALDYVSSTIFHFLELYGPFEECQNKNYVKLTH